MPAKLSRTPPGSGCVGVDDSGGQHGMAPTLEEIERSGLASLILVLCPGQAIHLPEPLAGLHQ